MTTTIALAGKGGTGKTTVAAMVIKYLLEKQESPILAIDADPSANLNMVLGVELDWTVGEIREDMLEKVKSSAAAGGAAMGSLAGGMSKRDYLSYEIQSSVIESDRFDLIAMGRSEGPGCYCAVNHNLREIIDSLSHHYGYVVIDNEAGMEHLSRRTTRNVQHLLVISDPTQRGIVAAERIGVLKDELEIEVENTYLILNRAPAEIPAVLLESIHQTQLPYLGPIPNDEHVMEYDFQGKPLLTLDKTSPIYQAVERMLDEVLPL